jgi:hypothetical protein
MTTVRCELLFVFSVEAFSCPIATAEFAPTPTEAAITATDKKIAALVMPVPPKLALLTNLSGCSKRFYPVIAVTFYRI